MSEDVSAQIRTGVTIIVVAALVATLLNLMVIAQSIVSSGMSTLQAGVDSVLLQEYAQFDQKTLSGTQVKSALALYSGREIGVIIQTKLAQEADRAYIYGTLLSTAANGQTAPSLDSDDPNSKTYYITGTALKNSRKSGESNYTLEYYVVSQVTQYCYNTKNTLISSDMEYILESARYRAELVKNKSGNIVGIVFTQLT